MRKYVLLSLSVLFLASCGNKGGSSSSTTSSNVVVNGNLVLGGTVYVNSSCGTTTAYISLNSSYGGQTLASTQVASGGTYTFQVASGTYYLTAQAGSCGPVYAQVQPVGTSSANICLSVAGGCPTMMKAISPKIAEQKVLDTKGPNCEWNVYGCLGHAMPDSGDIFVTRSDIQFASGQTGSVSLNLDFTQGNSIVSSSPSIGSGWQGDLKDGQVYFKAANEAGAASDNTYGVASMLYGAQIDSKFLQLENGFCDTDAQILARMAEYLKLSGFSDSSITNFQSTWKSQLPSGDKICAYPQEAANIEKAITYSAKSKISAKKMWFIVVPQVDVAVLKVRPAPGKFVHLFTKPKTDSLAALKKAPQTRNVASDSLSAEEVGVGFLIER
jgi:hypothetical protein